MTEPRGPTDLISCARADVNVLRRDDLAALAARSRQARPGAFASIGPPVAGLVTFAVVTACNELLGWTLLSAPVGIGAGLLVCATAAARLWKRERARRADVAYACPACGAEILSATPGADDGQRVQLAIATGCCPGCGARILAD